MKKSRRISFSQLEIFNECPYHWYVTYIMKMRSPNNPFALFGTAMHSLLEQVYKEKIFEPQPYIERWKNVFRKEYLKGDYPSFEKSMLDWQLSRGYPMIHNFFKVAKENDLLKPAVATEKKLTGTFQGYDVIGYTDLIHTVENKLTIIDYKTGKKEYDNHTLQATLYKELENNKRKTNKIEQCAIWYLGNKKLKIIKEDRKGTALYIKNTISDMEKMLKENKFEKRKNQWCSDCIAHLKGMCEKNERITKVSKK